MLPVGNYSEITIVIKPSFKLLNFFQALQLHLFKIFFETDLLIIIVYSSLLVPFPLYTLNKPIN